MRKTRRKIEKLNAQIRARAKRKTKLGRTTPTATPEVIQKFMQTRWGQPTALRHKAHIEACKRQDCEDLIEPFARFVEEVLGAPEDFRDEMLEMKPVEPYQAIRRYDAYITPAVLESKLDFYSARMGNKMGARISQNRAVAKAK